MSVAKGIEILEREGPLPYEVGYPIETIERMIELGLVSVSEPYRKYDPRINGWRVVQDVALKSNLRAALK